MCSALGLSVQTKEIEGEVQMEQMKTLKNLQIKLRLSVLTLLYSERSGICWLWVPTQQRDPLNSVSAPKGKPALMFPNTFSNSHML